MNDTLKGLGLWVLVIGAVILFCGFENKKEDAKKRDAEEKKRSAEVEFQQVCESSQAIPALKDLPDHDLLTIDLQRALFIHEKRVAFKAQLDDLYFSQKMERKASFLLTQGAVQLGVCLKCTENQEQELLTAYHKDKDAYFIIVSELDQAEPNKDNSDSKYKYSYDSTGTLIFFKVTSFKVMGTDNAKEE
jgi:hypothetical protein